MNYPPIIISLCDLTGNMVKPWHDNGFDILLVDPQHPTTNLNGSWATFSGIIEDAMPHIGHLIRTRTIAGVFGFPPCTDMAVSGARWFKDKIAADPYVQGRAFMIAEQCRTIGELAGGFYMFENPKSILSSVMGPPDHKFHPYEYTAYEPADNYQKETWLWTSKNFKMPPPHMIDGLPEPDNRIHHASPGPERSNFRSQTPKGFAQAVYEYNGVKL